MAFEIAIDLTAKSAHCCMKETRGDTTEARVESGPDALATLLACIEEGAGKWGSSLQDLLGKTRSVTLRAPDIIPDTLTNKSGARIGLIVSEGHEKKAYFEGRGENPAIDSIVARDMIVGIHEDVSDMGEAVLGPSAEDVKDKVRVLLESGSGIVAVSLKNAHLNGANEGLVREIIESDYPRHYLGAVPVLAASDFSRERDDFLRTAVCLLNAYAWFNLDHFLRRVESLLQKNGYNDNLLVKQADGDSVSINGVTPLKTCASDQIAFIRSALNKCFEKKS